MESSVIILEGENTKAVAFGISFLLAFCELCGFWPQLSGLFVLRGYFFGALNSYGKDISGLSPDTIFEMLSFCCTCEPVSLAL